jgi:pyrroline-5-carboxylate reductase
MYNVQTIKDAEIIIVALKPFNILEILNELSTRLIPGKHILISLTKGISLKQI